MNRDVQAFFEQYDQRRALAPLARAAMLRQRRDIRAWLIIWPSIPKPEVYATARCAPMDLQQCAA